MMNRIFAALLILTLPLITSAQGLVQFTNGQVADANEINANFQSLETRLADIEALTTQLHYYELHGLVGGWQVKTVDCSEDPSALDNSEILEDNDRLRIRLIGTCDLDQNFLLTGQKLLLDGGSENDTGANCSDIATIRFPDRGESQSLTFTLNSSSVLYLKCVTLDARDGVLISAFSNSYIRTEYGVSVPRGDMRISVTAQSLFRTFHPPNIASLSIGRSSSAEIYTSDEIELSTVYVTQMSNFFCRVCARTYINALVLSESSSAYFRPTANVLRIGSLEARQGSSVIFPDNDCNNLSVDIITLRSNSSIYQGSDGELACDGSG